MLAQTPADSIDVVFLDADRREYPAYWDDLVRILRRPGLLAIDNVISHAQELAPFRAVVDADDRAISAVDTTGSGVLFVSLPAPG